MGKPQSRTAIPSRRLLLSGLIVAAVLVVAAALVGVRSGEDDKDRVGRTAGGTDPGIAHVHGLGLDPADGALMVATHSGLFRIPQQASAPASRVGDSFQDTMGFTVAGPNHYLGSGHPDAAAFANGQPGLLGLIESVDGGETWQPLSLEGETDFHGLAVAGQTTYGWDATSGRLMATTDRLSWVNRSTVDLLGFAVDPADPEHLLGASPDGIIESADGGRTWSVADGPALVAVSWDRRAGLWGVDGGGQVWQRGASATWDTMGRLVGEPHAFLATVDGFYAASTDDDDLTTIFGSSDARQWEPLYRDGD